MAPRQMKMPEKGETDHEPEQFSQKKRPEAGRFLLQVDRQTKGSYPTVEAAQTVGLVIKKNYPIIQVSVYDTVDCMNTLVELPSA
jgi:hypothetical protein